MTRATCIPLLLALLAAAALLWTRTPPDERPPSAPSSAHRRRRERTGPLDIARMVERLATVLGTGAGLRGAWDAVARSLPDGELTDLSRAAAAGAEPGRACPEPLRSSEAIRSLDAALRVCERSGAPAAGVLHALADALRDLHDGALERRSAFAGPRSTARILLVLPLAGLGLGMLLGGDPLRLLVETGGGRLLLILGIALTLLGWWWMRRMLERADPPHRWQVDPSVLLELIAGVLSSGLPLAGAIDVVASALDPGDEAEALARTSRALAAGVPAPQAVSVLPEELGALGESALLAETSGADLSAVLRSAARDVRRGQVRDAQERSAKLAVALVLPTGVALLPAFVVLGIIPTVVSLLGGAVALAG
ncbi:type II secretion system F family protein [Brachybacterium sp. DNPG3]